MIFSDRSKRLLKQQIVKSKLIEHGIPREYYPIFAENSNELSIPAIYILSRYSEGVIENNLLDQDIYSRLLIPVARYFEASYGAADRTEHDSDFIVSGAAAYFLSGDFKRAKALCTTFFRRSGRDIEYINKPQKMLVEVLEWLLMDQKFPLTQDEIDEILSNIVSDDMRLYYAFWKSLLEGFELGKDKANVIQSLQDYREFVFVNKDVVEIYFVDILFAVVQVAFSESQWSYLSKCSGLSMNLWSNYLNNEKTPQILSPVLRIIAEKGVLRGKNALIQLSSYDDKTRSIELVSRSAFLSGRAETAIVVAPTQALCSEITDEMESRLGKDVLVTQYSNTLKGGNLDSDSDVDKSKMLVCTSKELSSIICDNKQLLKRTGVFVFTDGYTQGANTVEANFELLLSEMREYISKDKQFILLSSAMTNPEDLKRWFLDDDSVLVVDKKIGAAPRSFGLVTNDGKIHYFFDDLDDEACCVPYGFETVELQKIPQEKQVRYFPERNNVNDIALFWANKLLRNGRPAILVDCQDSIKSIIDRMVEVKDRGCNLLDLRNYTNSQDIDKLVYMLCDEYGYNHWLTQSYHQGVAVLYPNLPEGIKLAAEDLIRKNKLKLIICTPEYLDEAKVSIKYLLVASALNDKKIAFMLNLRNPSCLSSQSELRAETDIIFINSNLGDSENNSKVIKIERWKKLSERLGSNQAKPCSSSFLSLVSDVKLNDKETINGTEIVDYILEHYEDGNCFENLGIALSGEYPKYRSIVNEALSSRKKTMIDIENHLCRLISKCNKKENVRNLVVEFCKTTLAYQMANDEEKIEIERLFDIVSVRILNLGRKRIITCAKASVGIDCFTKIESFVSEKGMMSKVYSDDELVALLVSIFADDHKLGENQRAIFENACSQWINGVQIGYMAESYKDIPIYEYVCKELVSKRLTHLVGAIIQVVQDGKPGKYDPVAQLLLLQRRLKYGVKCETAASFCEVVFNDRLVADWITGELKNSNVSSDNIVNEFKKRKTKMLESFRTFPPYFSDRLNWLIEH